MNNRRRVPILRTAAEVLTDPLADEIAARIEKAARRANFIHDSAVRREICVAAALDILAMINSERN
ncbi:hypothetical protein AOQ71_31515 [Bradyrhizobium manausense]|uniref:Uncharacterized protein n=1 Tax=Bradyrhizobium manausense TaxID=989370 RepID=A0A0R3D0M3_9BRAD|nr:hypothetical protein AOQ71_31515 [Bradyrhizobium manausense]